MTGSGVELSKLAGRSVPIGPWFIHVIASTSSRRLNLPAATLIT